MSSLAPYSMYSSKLARKGVERHARSGSGPVFKTVFTFGADAEIWKRMSEFPIFELVVKFGALEQKGVEADVRFALYWNGSSNF